MSYRHGASVGPYCVGTGPLDTPKQHAKCSGTRARYLPGTPPGGAPVLPETVCGCTCHRDTVDQIRRH
ncbi:hypothetical protein ACFO3J_24045 [Streptomyces polygonati]|uniref:Uncharacterized protein n=1 Tax=Streptomyces polygonati TaxID=1617087 RepID=A0ABV8HR41_9ACTN